MQSPTAQTYLAQVKRITWIGVACNLLLSGLKLFLGITGGSQSLLADGIHSLSDLVTDAAVLFGANYWSEPADEAHPYGHRKLEALVTLFIGGTLFVVALRQLFASAHSFHNPSLHYSHAMLIVATLSIIVKECLYQATYRRGVLLGSTALKANAWHHRSDALSSIPVFLVLLLIRLNPKWIFLDGLGGVVVSLFIFRAAFLLLRQPIKALIDSGLSHQQLEQIKKATMKIPGVEAVHCLRSRVNGNVVFLDMHILVDKDMTVYQGHKLAHAVRDKLVADYGLTDVLVHVEPFTDEEKEEGLC